MIALGVCLAVAGIIAAPTVIARILADAPTDRHRTPSDTNEVP